MKNVQTTWLLLSNFIYSSKRNCFVFSPFLHELFMSVLICQWEKLRSVFFCFVLACFIYNVGTLHSSPRCPANVWDVSFSFCVSRRLVCRLLLTCLFIVVMKSFWLVEELCGFFLLLPDRDRNKFTLAATLQMLVKRQNECLQGLHTTSGAGYCQSVSDVCEEELLFLFLFVCGKVLRPKGSEEIHSHFNWWVLC